MSSICLIDTSILLNILDVPNRNKERKEILEKFSEFIKLDLCTRQISQNPYPIRILLS